MIILGLTGNIGMGKSTVAEMFRYLGFPTQDADKVVHGLMGPNGEALPMVNAAFPNSVDDDGVDRAKLGEMVFGNPEKLRELEEILYPLVNKKRKEFLDQSLRKKAQIAILDVPLLFEKGLDKSCDFTAVVRAPDIIQRQRVLKRPDMTVEKFNNIKSQQMPIQQKMLKADFVIQTGLGKGKTMREVKDIVALLCDPKALEKWQAQRPAIKAKGKRSR